MRNDAPPKRTEHDFPFGRKDRSPNILRVAAKVFQHLDKSRFWLRPGPLGSLSALCEPSPAVAQLSPPRRRGGIFPHSLHEVIPLVMSER